MKKQTKKKQMQNNKQKRNRNKNKITPSGIILRLIYLDMLHHIQPHRDKEIMDKQREILKPFIKKEKNKTNKIKRGGHVFYYNILPEICGLDIHENDCIPSTLYFLGLLTYEASSDLARQREEGIFDVTILDWLNENFPGESRHVTNKLLDFRDYFLRTSRRGKSVFNDAALDEANNNFMAKLDFILPFNQMGVMAGYTKEKEAGHVFCIIKDEYGELHIIDPQQKRRIAIHSIRDAIRFLDYEKCYELVLYVQEDVIEEFNKSSPKLLRGPTHYSLPKAFNASRILAINRMHDSTTE